MMICSHPWTTSSETARASDRGLVEVHPAPTRASPVSARPGLAGGRFRVMQDARGRQQRPLLCVRLVLGARGPRELIAIVCIPAGLRKLRASGRHARARTNGMPAVVRVRACHG
jgi:hypothetical protein